MVDLSIDQLFITAAIVAAIAIVSIVASTAYVFGWEPPSFLNAFFWAPRWMVAIGLIGLVYFLASIFFDVPFLDFWPSASTEAG